MPEFINSINKFPTVAYYRFSSGALTTDSSGKGHTLTAIGTPVEATGMFGGGVGTSNGNAYSIANHADFQPTGAFTVGAWVKIPGSFFGHILQSYTLKEKWAGFMLLGDDNLGTNLQLAVGNNTGSSTPSNYQRVIGNTSAVDGKWHFVVGTYDGTYIRVFFDGKPDANPVAANAPVYVAGNNVRIGCQNDDNFNTGWFTGTLDDIFLINGYAMTNMDVINQYIIGARGRVGMQQIANLQSLISI